MPMRCWPARNSPMPSASRSTADALDARQAAERMIGRAPRWIEALVALRNILVAPFGLKTSGASASHAAGT